MKRPVISAATPRTLTHELMDLGLDPQAIAAAVQIFGAMAAESSDPVTVSVESEGIGVGLICHPKD
ncbi:MAG: hypothetical protein H6Q00_3160 [Holophagaceae bacterium]|nr:hypothetical protein [Holophagaceae bacterium]